MDLILVLLPLALLLAAIAVLAFVWAARKGQFDDLETPAMRILFEDPPAPEAPPERPPSPAGDEPPGDGNEEKGSR